MKKDKRSAWFYVSLLPSVYVVLASLLYLLVEQQNWGSDKNLSSILTIFLYETTFVVSMLGSLAYLGNSDKSSQNKNIRNLNLSYALFSLLLSIQFFIF